MSGQGQQRIKNAHSVKFSSGSCLCMFKFSCNFLQIPILFKSKNLQPILCINFSFFFFFFHTLHTNNPANCRKRNNQKQFILKFSISNFAFFTNSDSERKHKLINTSNLSAGLPILNSLLIAQFNLMNVAKKLI